MKPIKFKEQNKILTRPEFMTDKECRSLPIYTDGKWCISCWKMGFKEKLKALFFGRIWVWIHSGGTQPPISLACYKSAFWKIKGAKND